MYNKNMETSVQVSKAEQPAPQLTSLRHKLATAAVTAVALFGAENVAHNPTALADSCTETQHTQADGTVIYQEDCSIDSGSTAAPQTSQHTSTASHARHFIDYNQNYNGDKWGSRIAGSGCGPTALAMVVATETGNRHITPRTIAREITPKWYAFGSGTAPGAFKAVARHYHLQERHVDTLSDAARIAKIGGLSIVHARAGGHFTGAGHYMVIKSYKDGKFRLADPNNAPGRDSEHRRWSASQLRHAGIDDVWTFQRTARTQG